MRQQLINLEFVLDELEIPSNYSSLKNRTKIHKAIYLAQMAGINLGYVFGWYTKGPFCPELASDCIELNNEV